MNNTEREEKILALLSDGGYVDNVELSKVLNCSTVTIRSEIRKLEKKGLLIRTHGGAKAISEMLNITIPSGNIFKDQENKRKIAEKAYEYINDRDTIILDDSSNSFYLAQIIKQKANKFLVVITNSLAIGCELSDCQNVEVMIIGGLLRGKLPSTMGESALEMLKQFRATKAFIGVHGVNPEVGITSIGDNQMQLKKLIFNIAQKVYVLVGSNKFNEEYLLVASPLSNVHRIITDKGLPNKYYSIIKSIVNLDIV